MYRVFRKNSADSFKHKIYVAKDTKKESNRDTERQKDRQTERFHYRCGDETFKKAKKPKYDKDVFTKTCRVSEGRW